MMSWWCGPGHPWYRPTPRWTRGPGPRGLHEQPGLIGMDDRPTRGSRPSHPRGRAYAGDMTNDRRDWVVRDPAICHGQAVVRGTRIMVSVILDCVASGMSEAEIVDEYETLTVEGVRAAAAHGAELARDEYPAVATG